MTKTCGIVRMVTRHSDLFVYTPHPDSDTSPSPVGDGYVPSRPPSYPSFWALPRPRGLESSPNPPATPMSPPPWCVRHETFGPTPSPRKRVLVPKSLDLSGPLETHNLSDETPDTSHPDPPFSYTLGTTDSFTRPDSFQETYYPFRTLGRERHRPVLS